MKFISTVVAVGCVFVNSTLAYDETTPCSTLEYIKFAPLASNVHLKPCQTASGFSMLPPSGYPTPAQEKIMCKTDECHALIADIIKIKPSDCVLVFGGVKLNVKKLSEQFEPMCAAASPSFRA
jgi:hypothetical protein